MDFVEILGSKSKPQNNKNFNEIAFIFWFVSKRFAERNDLMQVEI